MYGLFGRGAIRDLTPEEVAEGLAAARIMLIDVREPNETARERIGGALLAPLSQFDPIDLPDPQGRQVCSPARRAFVPSRPQRLPKRLDSPMTLISPAASSPGRLRDCPWRPKGW